MCGAAKTADDSYCAYHQNIAVIVARAPRPDLVYRQRRANTAAIVTLAQSSDAEEAAL
jgi:hypothetical protein